MRPQVRLLVRPQVRALVGTLAGLLLVSSLAGCASATDRYCSTLKDDKAQLQKLASSSDKAPGRVLTGSLAVFEDLQHRAPHDVAADWNDFVFAWRAVVDAFAAAGTDPSRFDPDQKPAGMSTGQFQAIKQAAAELGSQKVQAAAARIEDHAQTVCRVGLGGSGLGPASGGM
jgi:glucose-6-phosphate isomerase